MLHPEYGINNPPETLDEKVYTVIVHQNICAFLDSATLCKFGALGIVDFKYIAELWSSITGMNIDHIGILNMGDRIWYAERIANYIMGITNEDDKIPSRFTKEPISEGQSAGAVCDDFEEMLESFYIRRNLINIKDLSKKLEESEISDLKNLLI